MAEEDKKKSFWETLPGIITALAALLGGVAAVIAALNGGGKEGAAKTDAPSAAQAAPVKTPLPAVDDAAQRAAAEEIKRAKAETEAAKAELARVKAEAAAAKVRAEEAERRVAAARQAAEEERTKAEAAAPKQGDVTTDDTTGMELVYVPGGCFNMGSPPEEKDRYDDEGPVHEVCVDSFWMGQYEVTQGQWEKVMGANPSNFKKGGNYPVENVSWNDTQDFIKKLNKKYDKQYRLPTEAEWEYACRAKGSGRYCGGDDVDAVAWYSANSGDSTHTVGGKDANAFGLHDMSGNVGEWCADWYGKNYYASSPQSNPLGAESGSYRVIRGGGWYYAPEIVRTAYRGRFTPGNRGNGLGFRLVLSGQQGQAGR